MTRELFSKGGAFAENIRASIGGDDTELRASLKQLGWVAEFQALVEEEGEVQVGHRRLMLAKQLKIEPVIKTLRLGHGDAADAERLRVAIASNVGGKPMTKADRQHIAEYLYGKREWTMEKIGKALNVSHGTVVSDLRNLSVPDKLKPAKTASNPKGAGRPKRSKFGPEVEAKAASLVLDKGLSYDKAGKAVGVSNIVMRTAVAHERGRREERADPKIDPATLSLSAQQKLEAATRQQRRDVEATVADYREQLDAEFTRYKIEWLRRHIDGLNERMAEYDAVISARKGVMTRKVFDNIRRCLHPDSRQSASDERLAEAFRLFSKLELRLLSESDFPTRKLKPLNAADLLETKLRNDEARRAKANSKGLARR